MLGFLSHRTSPIGLDIGRDGIRMLQLAPVGSVLTAVASARWQFPDGAADDPVAKRRYTLSAVREMLASGGFRGRRVVTGLGGADLVIKQVRLPRMPERDLEAALRWEASERFGFKIEPDQLGCFVAGEVRQGPDVKDEIILLGARRETVDDHMSLLEELKLFPVAVDAEPIAIFRAFERFLRRKADADSVTVLLDVGAGATKVVIARGRHVSFVKTVDIGGRHFTQAVAQQLHMSPDEAAQTRQRLMQPPEDEPATLGESAGIADGSPVRTDTAQLTQVLYDAIRPLAEDLAREVSLCLRYHAVTFRGSKPDGVTLVGGESYDPNVVRLLQESLGVPCEPGNPLRGVELSRVDLGANRRGRLSEWALATGLALRNLPLSNRVREAGDEADRLSA